MAGTTPTGVRAGQPVITRGIARPRTVAVVEAEPTEAENIAEQEAVDAFAAEQADNLDDGVAADEHEPFEAPVVAIKPPVRSVGPVTTNGPKAAPSPGKLAFTISQGTVERDIKLLIYGAYGGGKTTLAASADDVESLRDVLFIDAESGDLSLEDRPWLDRIRINKYSQLARIHEFLKLHCRFRDARDEARLRELEAKFRGYAPDEGESLEEYRKRLPNLLPEPKHYRTVVLDSLSEVNKYCMYQLTGIVIGDRALDVEPDAPEYKEWGQSSEMTRLLVRSLRDLPMTVIFVCSMQEKEDEKKKIFRSPNLPGKLGGEVQGFLDVVGFLNAVQVGDEGKVVRRLYITPGETFGAKNRFVGNTVRFVDNPTMQSLLDIRQIAIDAATAAARR